MEVSVKQVELTRISPEGRQVFGDLVSVEEPLEIQIVTGPETDKSITPLSVTMRTPGHDADLSVGFLFTEGIIQHIDQIIRIEEVESNVTRIELDQIVKVNLQSLSRNFYTTSSCGVCGKASIDAIHVESAVNMNSFQVTSKVLESLPSKIIKAQESFQSTGGLHASALFDANGTLLLVREDVGRHNALDKVIGSMLLSNNHQLSDTILLVSGRASFELVQKAAVAGIPVVAAIGAPSSLAVELAQEKGISLIGFLKQDRFNIYTHPNRILIS